MSEGVIDLTNEKPGRFVNAQTLALQTAIIKLVGRLLESKALTPDGACEVLDLIAESNEGA